MVVHQQYVEAGLDIPVLEGIVKYYHLCVARGIVAGKAVHAVTSVCINGNVCIGEFLMHLVRLVAYLRHGGVGCCQVVAVRLAFVATAEHCHLELLVQQFYKILGVRGLARASHSDVAYGNNGNVEGT